jgi:hypothetical protein
VHRCFPPGNRPARKPGTGYLEELGFPDSRIKPDFDTFQVLPWADQTARILCEPCKHCQNALHSLFGCELLQILGRAEPALRAGSDAADIA